MEEFQKAAIRWVIAKLKEQRGNQVQRFINNLTMQENKDYAKEIQKEVKISSADIHKETFQTEIIKLIERQPDQKEAVTEFLKSFGYSTKEIEEKFRCLKN